MESVQRKILIADDSPLFRELEAIFLARSGRVTAVCNGTEALREARRSRPDIVVADLHMPETDGAEVCRQIKRDPMLAGVPVILVTRGDDPADHAKAVRSGADDVLVKPLSRVSLSASVNRFLRHADLRGLTRVPIDARVQIRGQRSEEWGTARNLSRGGIFIESEAALAPQDEVDLAFRLPESDGNLESHAEIVWRRGPASDHPAGLGLRFVGLDRRCTERIDEFVYVRADTPNPAERAAAAAR